MLLLALARQAKSLVLSGAAILFMAVCTVLEYYALSTTLLVKEQEIRLIYRIKKRGAKIGPGAFFFQEGQGKSFEKALFVELRTDKNGKVLFTRLLDENRQHILPGT